MTDKITRYWLVEGKRANAICDELDAANERGRDEAKAFARKYGKTKKCIYFTQGASLFASKLSGITIADGVDKTHWRQERNPRTCYTPRLSTKEGKEIAKEMAAIKIIDRFTYGDQLLGSRCIVTDLGMAGCGYEEYGESRIVSALDLDDYAERNNGWQPIPGLREIRPSQYHRLKEQHEAKEAVNA